MIWADKLAILWAIVVWAVLMVLGGGPGFYLTHLTDPDYFGEWLKVDLILIVPVWAFLRLIDVMLGGPARRRGEFRFRAY